MGAIKPAVLATGTFICARCGDRKSIRDKDGRVRVGYVRRFGYAHRDSVCRDCAAMDAARTTFRAAIAPLVSALTEG
jgi:hypothetical protein